MEASADSDQQRWSFYEKVRRRFLEINLNLCSTNVAALTDEADDVENAVFVNICVPPSASRSARKVSLYEARRRRAFFKR